MNSKLIEDIKGRMNEKTDEVLVDIWTKNDTAEWSEEAFEAIRLVFADRGITPPTQNLAPDNQRKLHIAESLNDLPAFPFKKAIRIERNFRVWSVLLALWLFFGFFHMFANFSNVAQYAKAIQNLRMASSPSFSVKPEFAEVVERASRHVDALETLQIYHVLFAGVYVVVWGSLFPIRKRFLNRRKEGPKYLIVALLALLGVHTMGALLTIPIPMADVMGFVDIVQIRVHPFAMGLILLCLTPFFGKNAEVFYQYTAIDKDVFSRLGAAWRFLNPTEIMARIAKLKARRRRAGYAAWAFLAAATVLIGTLLIVTKANMPAAVRLVVFILAAVIIIWTLVESTLLASALFSSSAAVLLGGILTYGIVSFFVILVLRKKVTKELALAPVAESGANTTANKSVDHYVSPGADAG